MAWRHMIFEGMCFYNISKDRFTEMFKVEQDEKGMIVFNKKGNFITKSRGISKNPCYIKGGEKLRPKWCKDKHGKNLKNKDMTPKNDCLFPKCPYLSLGDITPLEYKVMVDAWVKEGKRTDYYKDE